MPNIDSNTNEDTTKRFEYLHSTHPTSLESLTYPQPHPIQSSRAVHSDPEETQAKTKTKSRFSKALKKLSGSTRKKEKSVLTESEPILSSGTEDSPEPEKKSSKKKKTATSLFGLKKSKVAPKTLEEPKVDRDTKEDEISRLLEPIFHDTENEVEVTTERLSPLDSRRTVQITIKSKKIETLASQEQQKPNPPSSLSSTTPKTTPTTTTAVAEESPPKPVATLTKADDETLDNQKKLKTKVTTQTSQKSTTTTIAQSKSKQQPEGQEKIVITQSSKDTPPKEKAPTKPSRLATTSTSQPSAASGAVRKTATTARAAVKLVTAVKSKKKSLTKPSKDTNNDKSPIVIQKEADLMINPQRGHRLPTAATATISVKELQELPTAIGQTKAIETAIVAKKVTVKEPQELSKAIDESKAKDTALVATKVITVKEPQKLPTAIDETKAKDTTLATTTITVKEPQKLPTAIDEFKAKDTSTTIVAATATTTTLPTNTNEQQQMQQTETIKSTDYMSKTLPQTSSTPSEIQSSSLINASLKPPTQQSNETIKQQEIVQTSPIDNSVQSKSFKQSDDHISLAESVKPSEYSTDNPYDSRETIKEPRSVEFAVGSPVRPPPQPQPLYEFSIQESSIISQKDNDSDSSPISDTIRRRLQYIAQPTLYDEFNSLELKRAHYRYQSGVSDLSLDSDDNVETFDDLQPMPAFGDLTMDQDMEPTIMTSTNTEKREHLYKILVIGELGTGKTSFIKRYVHQFFSQNYRATIGVDFALKVLHWDPNTIVRLQLWDIAGQERFGNMTRVYYKEAVGAFIVFDVTRSGTFDCVSKWKEDLDSKVQLPDGNPIPCILLANKCDQDKQGVVTNAEKMDEYVKEHGFAGWFETSAKENINIDEAARALVNKILLNDKLISAADLADSEKFNLNNSGDQTMSDGKSKCSC